MSKIGGVYTLHFSNRQLSAGFWYLTVENFTLQTSVKLVVVFVWSIAGKIGGLYSFCYWGCQKPAGF